jgi:hypothetical protein
LFFAAQISIVAFVVLRASKADNLILDCDSQVAEASGSRTVLKLDGKEAIIAANAEYSLKVAADEMIPVPPLSNVERFLFGIQRRITIKFSATVHGTAKPKRPLDFGTNCVLESKE